MLASAAAARNRFAPDRYERVLAVSAVVLLVFVGIAVAKGRPVWAKVDAAVWLHLATIVVALVLTPMMLLRPRGDRLHRVLGYVWATAMILTAIVSFAVRNANHGRLGVIHILSAWVLIQVPLIVMAARAGNMRAHRTRVRAMVTGALLIAGFFTFPFNRMLGQWLFA